MEQKIKTNINSRLSKNLDASPKDMAAEVLTALGLSKTKKRMKKYRAYVSNRKYALLHPYVEDVTGEPEKGSMGEESISLHYAGANVNIQLAENTSVHIKRNCTDLQFVLTGQQDS